MPDLKPYADLRSRGLSRAQIIGAMCQQGLTITEAIRAARSLFGISLGEAKVLAADHPAYRKVAQAAQPLHDEFMQAFTSVAGPRSGSQPQLE